MMPLAYGSRYFQTPEFEHGSNSGLAIQAKNAILFAEDSPGSKFRRFSLPPRTDANYLSTGRVAEFTGQIRQGGLQRAFRT
jgi:hypothetical protein